MWRNIKLMSDDSHFEGSPDLWRGYVAKEFQKYVPKVVKLPNGGDGWEMQTEPPTQMGLGLNLSMGHGGPTGWENLKTTGWSFDDPSLVGAGDGEQRVRELDKDGIDAEVIYSPVGRGFAMYPPEVSHAIAQGYNDWLSRSYTAVAPGRLLGLAMLPSGSVENAVSEMKRVKDMPGIYAVQIHQWPAGGLAPAPEDELFWQAAEDTGVPLTFHIGFGGGQAADKVAKQEDSTGPMIPINGMLTKIGYNTAYCMTQLITQRVFDRHPSLRILISECGSSWVPFYAESADTNYMRHRYWAGIELDHDPSYYVQRNFQFGMQDDYAAVKMRDLIGVDNMSWGTDFPHVACNWPNTHKLLDRMFEGVPEEDARKILGGNLAKHLKLEEKLAAAA